MHLYNVVITEHGYDSFVQEPNTFEYFKEDWQQNLDPRKEATDFCDELSSTFN